MQSLLLNCDDDFTPDKDLMKLFLDLQSVLNTFVVNCNRMRNEEFSAVEATVACTD